MPERWLCVCMCMCTSNVPHSKLEACCLHRLDVETLWQQQRCHVSWLVNDVMIVHDADTQWQQRRCHVSWLLHGTRLLQIPRKYLRRRQTQPRPKPRPSGRGQEHASAPPPQSAASAVTNLSWCDCGDIFVGKLFKDRRLPCVVKAEYQEFQFFVGCRLHLPEVIEETLHAVFGWQLG